MNWRLPPKWVRRVVLAPLMVALAFVVMPVGLIFAGIVGAAITWLLPGRLRIVRAIWMVIFYILWDATALVAAFSLWIASGFGFFLRRPWWQGVHYRFAGTMLRVLFWQIRWTLRLQIDVVDAELGSVLVGQPIIVASRHAGPGDSFILVHALLNWFDRAPRIVLKDTLQWDPAIDVLLNRLPSQFITPRSARRSDAPRLSDAVGDLAAGLGPDGALVIFPEGGNVTPGRRARRIDTLREQGQHHLAEQAEQMVNVMAPHSGGLLSALGAASDAGVVFVAHTGLDRLVTVRDIWRELPMDKRIVMKGWSVPPQDVPRDPGDQEEWLFAHWRRIDDWIAAFDVAAAPDPSP
ncbi:1-acyl-sn-glycerol-3-phosphate acyltransferase [Cellulomonas composti]|uniref:Acyltransferase n=1 Tax=Cellulomonas composti TaxID=266130 RepID=A0A511JDJ2_9CELL|nr:1-acyl-sn-glycerol-3-phosphate acyltransferase [Cellulomonas composti]GEL96067.1 acyltransferase [Cellulomonas composti]